MDTNTVNWWMMAVEHYRQQLEELQSTYLTLKGAGLDEADLTSYFVEGVVKIMGGVPLV